MAWLRAVTPVKLILAILWWDAEAYEVALERLVDVFGPLDVRGPEMPFDATDYYREEMGEGLRRQLFSFARLVPPDAIRQAKLYCHALEHSSAVGPNRRINLDIGYLDHNKLVLASLKAAGQKIYLGTGVYADLVARYAKGAYRPFEWTFPDFRDGRYDAVLAEIRSTYLGQLRQ